MKHQSEGWCIISKWAITWTEYRKTFVSFYLAPWGLPVRRCQDSSQRTLFLKHVIPDYLKFSYLQNCRNWLIQYLIREFVVLCNDVQRLFKDPLLGSIRSSYGNQQSAAKFVFQIFFLTKYCSMSRTRELREKPLIFFIVIVPNSGNCAIVHKMNVF